jgi:hypothetical protein
MRDSDKTILDRMPTPVKRGVPKWVWIALGVLAVAAVLAFVFH